MGMAASQARYLALTARKSNCEYEGQQINQARTALSNQSANLFNQMLGLQVPVPPSTQDFTKTQYSFTDGVNKVTMDNWNQLATPEEDYNYVVTYHYTSDVYTGSQKKMNDPQVQVNTEGTKTNADELKLLASVLTNAKSAYDTALKKQEEAKTKLDEVKSKYTSAVLQKQTDEANLISISTKISELQAKLPDIKTYQSTKSYASTKGGVLNGDGTYTITRANDVTATYTPYASCGTDVQDALQSQLDTLTANGVTGIAATDLYYNAADGTIALKSDLDNALSSAGAARVADLPVMNTQGLNTISSISETINTQLTSLQEQQTELQTKITDVDTPLVDAAQVEYQAEMGDYSVIENEVKLAENTYLASQNEYNAFQTPSYIGNCQLTLLEGLTKEQDAEISQVVRDMKAQGVDGASINKCFDDNGNYLGGIYQFKLNGITYYTTIDDLYNSYESGTNFGNNITDTQEKMAYYNASYVSTKIEATKKALLETDSQGRFSSIRIEDDSVTFTLNMETITDDKAYQDAMNQYYYENAQYDKMVQDINAKTSLIQQEDQQLELRLKQLDTEQNALSTEIDAVSKVVKDNVEKSFKTFGG